METAARRAWHLIALCLLFVGLLSPVWRIGVVVHDDAGWVLDSLIDPVHDAWEWAKAQGRLYAFPDGLMMMQVYRRDGTILGEVLKFGSFALALIGLGAVLRAYWGWRIATLSMTLFLGLLALQFDYGSALLAYPLLVWPAICLACAAILAGRRHLATGGVFWLILAGFAAFLCCFTNEGMTLTLAVLIGLCWVFNGVSSRRNRKLGGVLAAALFLYAAAAMLFHGLYPSDYEGTKLAKFDLGRILGVLAAFSTSASDLHAVFLPYSITFTDGITGGASTVTYSLRESFIGAAGGIAAVMQALIVGALCWFLLSKHQTAAAGEERAVLPGIVLTILPILPVSLIERYQDWHTKFGVNAYLTTIVAHLGLSVIMAAAICALIRRAGPARLPIAAAFACGVALLSFAGLRANERIAGDIRPEGARWEVLRQAVPLLLSTGWNTRTIAMPQLENGGWFAVMTPQYWTDFASAYSGHPVTVVYGGLAPDTSPQGAAILAYVMSEDRRAFDLVLGHQLWDGDGRPRIDSIVVQPGRDIDSEAASIVLSYVDRQGRSQQRHLRDLRRDGRRFVLDSADAVAGSIRVMRQSMPHS